jgi:two-component system cell cycle response regulator DivK
MPARVLLLENDPATRELICYLLDRYRHDAIAAGTPEIAMGMLTRETPDMIVSDLQLGRSMDGYAFGAWCRTQAELATIPLVCITASWDKYRPDKIQTAGFTALIPKPINPEAFVNQLEFYLPYAKWGTPPYIPE